MSGARHRRRRSRSVVHIDREGVEFMVGWTATPADLFAIQALLHDRLIVHLGTRRRGGVEWAVVTINEARALLDKMRAFTENPQLLAQYGLLEQTMAVRGGYLVVAHAPATPP